jgi:hypothetical protein
MGWTGKFGCFKGAGRKVMCPAPLAEKCSTRPVRLGSIESAHHGRRQQANALYTRIDGAQELRLQPGPVVLLARYASVKSSRPRGGQSA